MTSCIRSLTLNISKLVLPTPVIMKYFEETWFFIHTISSCLDCTQWLLVCNYFDYMSFSRCFMFSPLGARSSIKTCVIHISSVFSISCVFHLSTFSFLIFGAKLGIFVTRLTNSKLIKGRAQYSLVKNTCISPKTRDYWPDGVTRIGSTWSSYSKETRTQVYTYLYII